MKRFAVLFLAAVLSFSLAACQGQEEELLEISETVTSPAETQGQEELAETAESAETAEPENNILIAYFTLGRNAEYDANIDASTSASLVLDGEELVGTTEYVARRMQAYVGGDLHLIQVTEPYPADFDAVVDQNHEEADAGILPELVASDLDVSQYDTVFLGYPVWATSAPQAIFTFLSQYDLS